MRVVANRVRSTLVDGPRTSLRSHIWRRQQRRWRLRERRQRFWRTFWRILQMVIVALLAQQCQHLM